MASRRKQISPKRQPPAKLPKIFIDLNLTADTCIISKCTSKQPLPCHQCKIKRRINYKVQQRSVTRYICFTNCLENFKRENPNYYNNWPDPVTVICFENRGRTVFIRSCFVCKSTQDHNYSITWQSMDFCNESCLLELQVKLGSLCLHCGTTVPLEALGEFSVRFGGDIRQFCSKRCWSQHKQCFAACAYCLQNCQKASKEIIFCGSSCQKDHAALSTIQTSSEPKVCKTCGRYCTAFLRYDNENLGQISYFCSHNCFMVFYQKYFIDAALCCYCKKFAQASYLKKHVIFDAFILYIFCSSICRKLYISANRVMVTCDFCNKLKDKYEMVRRYAGTEMKTFCSLKCWSLNHVQQQVSSFTCYNCNANKPPAFSFPISDGNAHHFCCLHCLANSKCETTEDELISEYLRGQCHDFETLIKIPLRSILKSSKNNKIQNVERQEGGKKKGVRFASHLNQIRVLQSEIPEFECIYIPGDKEAPVVFQQD